MGLSSTHLDTDLCVDQRATRGTSSWGLSTAHFCTVGFCCVAIRPALGIVAGSQED